MMDLVRDLSRMEVGVLVFFALGVFRYGFFWVLVFYLCSSGVVWFRFSGVIVFGWVGIRDIGSFGV